MQFVIIVAMYNMSDRITENIKTLQNQSYRDFRCLIGDDLSTDDSVQTVRALTGKDSRFQLIAHSEKKFSLGNIHTLIEIANPKDDDILVLVDGDDKLSDDYALERLAKIYKQYKCWMTYGSYASPNGELDPVCAPYPDIIIRTNKYRQASWRASHLKTFKYKLWKRIELNAFTITEAEYKQALRRALFSGRIRCWLHWRKFKHTDLLNPCGSYIIRCSDKAITLPMLEMAGPKARFINQILYTYHTYEKPLNYGSKQTDEKWYTRCIRDIVRHKPRYDRINEL